MLKNVLSTRRLSPASAAKLRGRLGFAQALLFGKFGRAKPHDFTLRQYSSGEEPLSASLLDTARWWIGTLNESIPREIRFGCPEPVVVYTDAQGAGHIAAVLLKGSPDAVGLCHTHAPPWMMNVQEVEERIFEFELTGVALGVTLAIARFPGTPIVICCDNKGAIGTVIRGSCKTQLGRDISSFCGGWPLKPAFLFGSSMYHRY